MNANELYKLYDEKYISASMSQMIYMRDVSLYSPSLIFKHSNWPFAFEPFF